MKRFFSALLVTAMLLTLTACGGGGESSSAPQGGGSSGGGTSQSSGGGSEGWVPTQDIEFVIPFGAGGGNDVMVRKIIEIIQKNNMCPVNIVPVNKEGGSGVVGYSYLTSKGEGYEYSLASTSASFYTQPLTGNSPFTADEESFSFVAHMVKDPTALVAAPNRGFTNLQDVIDYAKEHPGELKWGGIGVASDDAILMYMLNDMFDINLVYVPYDSGGELMTAVMGNHLDLAIMSPAEGSEQMTTGGVVPLAVCADERIDILPDVPTFIEQGADTNHQQDRGIVMNPGVSDEVLAYYSDLFKQVSETEEWQEFLDTNFMAASFMDYQEYAEYNADVLAEYTEYLALIPQD